MASGFWASVLLGLVPAVIKTLLDWLGVKAKDEAHDGLVRDAAIKEQRVHAAQQTIKIQKDMANAQAAAPRDRRALAERLRTEAHEDGEPGA